jgi:hypothetical protein
VVTMVWVVSKFRLQAPPGISPPDISPFTPSGQRNCASWASQPQKSVTLSPQPGGKTARFIRTCGGIGGGGGNLVTCLSKWHHVPGDIMFIDTVMRISRVHFDSSNNDVGLIFRNVPGRSLRGL